MQSLVTLYDSGKDFSEALQRRISDRVMRVFAENGIGAPAIRGRTRHARQPTTVAELMDIPAISHVLALLDPAAATTPRLPGGKPSKSASAELFRKAADADQLAQEAFMAHAGMHVLFLLRQYCMHAPLSAAAGALESRLTEAVVDQVAHEAALEVIRANRRKYFFDVRGALLRRA